MRFCPQCRSRMNKITNATGGVVFRCHCQFTVPGAPDDTLMASGSYEQQENDQKHAIFIDRSPHDLAGNIVMKSCPQCKLDFVTMIRIGVNETTMYTCTCGWRATHDAYMASSATK